MKWSSTLSPIHRQPAKINQRIRPYVVNAGPNLASAFHTIGSMFAPFYPVCDATHALTGVSTYSIAAGQGVMLDLIIPQAGKYPIGDHSMRNMMLGATNVLEVAR